jgi:hypothetical protein
MLASNPDMAAMLASAEDAAAGVVEAVLAGERYILTHGDLVQRVAGRSAELSRAAEAASQK